ncbi:hypothetical protein FACS189465_0320 [Clostridia bacterium]|nr:hypothetical protein FACS189465_0320 [Clostridia bacterium]
MLAQTLPEIFEATTILKKLSQNEKVRVAYEAREREIRDELSRMKSAERKGMREGKKIGIKKRNIEIARNALKLGSTRK